MNNRYLSFDFDKTKNKKISLNLKKSNPVESNINPNTNINILKYLTELEKNNTIQTKRKSNLKKLPSLNYNLLTFSQKHLNKSVNLNTINISNNDDGCFLTSLDLEKKEYSSSKDIKKNEQKDIKNKIKERLYGINRNNWSYKNKYNLATIIKDIKKKNSPYVSNTEGNYYNEILAYDNKNMKEILDINNIINSHLKNKEWDLSLREEKYNDYKERKKEVCVNNNIIKLIKREREQIINRYKKYSYDFSNQIKAVNEGEQIFEKIIQDQKRNNKILEDNYYKLKNDNKILIYLRENYKDQVRKTEYEILKKIYEIDELRLYAKFVNHIYGYDISLFDKSILDKDYSKNPVGTDALIKNVLNTFKSYLNNEKNDTIDKIDPDIVLNEIILIENRILMNLKVRDQEYEDLKKYKLNNKNILNNIESRKLELENEYNIIKKEIDDIILKTTLNLNEDLFLISKDLNIFILEFLSGDKKLIKKYKGNLNLFEISDLAQKSMELILEKESMLDKYLAIMEKCDKEDKNLFSSLLNKRKVEIIKEKTTQAKKNVERKQFLNKVEIRKNSDKIYFINRKAQPNLPKKKKKVIKIPPEIILQQENKEMISYE